MHKSQIALLVPVLWIAIACDTPDSGSGQQVAAQRPEGWESLDSPQSALRLYYQFVDENRRVRFVERLEEVPPQWRANVGFVRMAVAPPLSPGDAAKARRSAVASGVAAATGDAGAEVILYSAEWCGACKKAKGYLARNDVPFDERDVDNPRIADELVGKTGRRSIPVLDVDGRVFTGFDPNAYQDLIGG